ncbi:MAG: permease, partial [Alphaproteobacteria bacterium]|nr:permease [Alphaproteobacteria bacterium]
MAVTDELAEIPQFGEPAPIARIFGWSIIGALAAYLINNVLTVGFDYPFASSIFSGGGSAAIVPVLVYMVAIGLAVFYVLRSGDTSLRWDARKLHNFNKYLIRAFFWSVLMVGIVDVSLAFLRVEKILPTLVNAQLASDLGRSHFV